MVATKRIVAGWMVGLLILVALPARAASSKQALQDKVARLAEESDLPLVVDWKSFNLGSGREGSEKERQALGDQLAELDKYLEGRQRYAGETPCHTWAYFSKFWHRNIFLYQIEIKRVGTGFPRASARVKKDSVKVDGLGGDGHAFMEIHVKIPMVGYKVVTEGEMAKVFPYKDLE